MPRNRSEKVPDWHYELVAFALEVEKHLYNIRLSGIPELRTIRDRMSDQAKAHWNYATTWRHAAEEVFRRYGRDAGPYSGTRVSG